jgi:hypothetical protein
MAREKLLRENINISHFVELSSPQTGVALVMVEAPTGRYMIAVAKSPTVRFRPSWCAMRPKRSMQPTWSLLNLRSHQKEWSKTAKLCSHYKKRLVLYASPVGPRSRMPEGATFLTVLSIREALALAETREVSYAVHWLHDRGSQNQVLVDGAPVAHVFERQRNAYRADPAGPKCSLLTVGRMSGFKDRNRAARNRRLGARDRNRSESDGFESRARRCTREHAVSFRSAGRIERHPGEQVARVAPRPPGH